ncbi:MAG: 3-deoxy-7-phosphoheptulonate synthase [Firmicutes bacterium]|nr:3-deoxy-7-phosphoheptulonate synthase [Bacillota bacterium]
MIVVMRWDATDEDVRGVERRLAELGFTAHISRGRERTVVGAIGDRPPDPDAMGLESLPGVERVMLVQHSFKLASRDFRAEPSRVRVGDVVFGGDEVVVIAGPCAVESREQILETAAAVRAAGARMLRGGAFKPRTSPYSFQGLEEEGLKLLAEARERTGLPVVTEVMSPEAVPLVAAYADMLQIGARNMQNFPLLRAVGRVGRPVMLKRGPSATIEEWLQAAEYILAAGNDQVVLCERGIRTFETATRNTLDLNAVPVLKEWTHLPVVVDPSHGTGKWRWVKPMALAAVAAGADALIVEVHPQPSRALSDGSQSLTPKNFEDLMREAAAVARAVGRRLGLPAAADARGAGAVAR